jgi:hypothetical protein
VIYVARVHEGPHQSQLAGRFLRLDGHRLHLLVTRR